jgi:hypothetical protein
MKNVPANIESYKAGDKACGDAGQQKATQPASTPDGESADLRQRLSRSAEASRKPRWRAVS